MAAVWLPLKMLPDKMAHLPSDPNYTEQDTISLRARFGIASSCIYKAIHPEMIAPILYSSELSQRFLHKCISNKTETDLMYTSEDQLFISAGV